MLAQHEGRAHRLCLIPGASCRFLSCGEDGRVYGFDLREPRKTRLLTLADEDGDSLPIFALSVDPLRPYNFVVGGTPAAVSLFDARRLPSSSSSSSSSSSCEPVNVYCPRLMRHHGRGRGAEHVTGVAYSWNGEEFLATYNDGDIYRFDIARDAVVPDHGSGGGGDGAAAAAVAGAGEEEDEEEPSRRRVRARREEEAAAAEAEGSAEDEEHEEDEEDDDDDIWRTMGYASGFRRGQEAALALREEEAMGPEARGYRMVYRGHRNDRTVKQVSFYGSRSEFIVSGSDDGHIFVWEREAGRLVQLLHADRIGAVNCLEPHPNLPMLATSGLENDAKVCDMPWWIQSNSTRLTHHTSPPTPPTTDLAAHGLESRGPGGAQRRVQHLGRGAGAAERPGPRAGRGAL